MLNNPPYKKGGSRGYVSIRLFKWHIGTADSPHVVKIEEGFEFESSVPKFLQWIWSPDDPDFLLAAMVHDKLLEMGWRRQGADAQWYEVAQSQNAPKCKTMIAYLGMVLRRFILSK